MTNKYLGDIDYRGAYALVKDKYVIIIVFLLNIIINRNIII